MGLIIMLSLLTTCFMVNLYRAMVAHSTVFFVVFIALYQTDPVNGCTVNPSAVAILSGTNISVACIPASGESVVGWERQNAQNKTVYAAQVLNTNRYVADGYSVNESNSKENILTLISASIQYADNYECICFPSSRSNANTNITVIDSEPQFYATDGLSLSIDDPVEVKCSLKLAGNASVLMQITNSAGKVFSTLEAISTNVSQLFIVAYKTSSAIEKMYFCKISLVNDGSDQKTTIFNRTLARTVQFSARSVSISPENPEHCQNGGLCEKNSVINCTANGSPEPSYNFTIFDQNGTLVRFLPNQQKYTTAYVGQQFIQCTAFNVINGSVYSNSINFTTNVIETSIVPDSADGSNIPLIVGLVVGLGGGILIFIIVVIIICYRRQRNAVYKGSDDPYTHPQVPQSPSEREHAYTGINLSRDAQDTDAHNDRPTYDYVIQMH